MNECALNRTTRLLPRVLFVVELDLQLGRVLLLDPRVVQLVVEVDVPVVVQLHKVGGDAHLLRLLHLLDPREESAHATRREARQIVRAGHGEGLARPGYPEQHLIALVVAHSRDQFPDCIRLVAGRLKIAGQLERLSAFRFFRTTGLVRHKIFAGPDDSQQAQKNGGVAVDDRGCGGGPNTKQL